MKNQNKSLKQSKSQEDIELRKINFKYLLILVIIALIIQNIVKGHLILVHIMMKIKKIYLCKIGS